MCSFLVLSIGLGYSFRITELLEPFNEGRQGDSDVEEQILPVFAVAFIATAISNILGSIQPGIGLWASSGDFINWIFNISISLHF